MKYFRTLSILIATSILVACTDVHSFLPDEYTAVPDVKLMIDWSASGVVASQRPDSLSVVFGRLVNINHRWLRCPSGGFGVKDTLSLPCGEWIGLALDDRISNVRISGLEEFRSNGSAMVKDIIAHVDTMTYTETLAARGAVDTNPSMPMYKQVDRLVCGFRRTSIDGRAGSDNSVVFEMQDLSAPISFSFDIDAEDDIEVLSVQGEISGVPGELNMMSREVVAFRTGRSLFDFAPANGDGAGSRTRWKGSAGILGIVQPDNGNTLLGNGILTVRVKVLSQGAAKTFIASMNLKSVLDLNPVLRITDRDKVYCRAVSGPMEYTLTNALHLTKDGVEPEQGSGVGVWVNQAKIDKEI